VNIVFLGVMNFILWLYVTNPKRNLVEGLPSDEKKYFSIRAITVPIIFIVIALVYLFISPRVAVWVPPVIPVIMRILRWKYRKNDKPKKILT
jgi:hypothetical protein